MIIAAARREGTLPVVPRSLFLVHPSFDLHVISAEIILLDGPLEPLEHIPSGAHGKYYWNMIVKKLEMLNQLYNH